MYIDRKYLEPKYHVFTTDQITAEKAVNKRYPSTRVHIIVHIFVLFYELYSCYLADIGGYVLRIKIFNNLSFD